MSVKKTLLPILKRELNAPHLIFLFMFLQNAFGNGDECYGVKLKKNVKNNKSCSVLKEP